MSNPDQEQLPREIAELLMALRSTQGKLRIDAPGAFADKLEAEIRAALDDAARTALKQAAEAMSNEFWEQSANEETFANWLRARAASLGAQEVQKD